MRTYLSPPTCSPSAYNLSSVPRRPVITSWSSVGEHYHMVSSSTLSITSFFCMILKTSRASLQVPKYRDSKWWSYVLRSQRCQPIYCRLQRCRLLPYRHDHCPPCYIPISPIQYTILSSFVNAEAYLESTYAIIFKSAKLKEG